MIQVKNALQLAATREAGRITCEALLAARESLREGLTTFELAKIIHD
jgi:methionine aminopeptidase